MLIHLGLAIGENRAIRSGGIPWVYRDKLARDGSEQNCLQAGWGAEEGYQRDGE